LVKVSLHNSGVWVAAFTKESGVVLPELAGNRRFKQWAPPPEFAPGWIRGPGISVPRVDEKHDLPAKVGSNFRSVLWIATPPVGSAAFLMVLFAADRAAHPAQVGHTDTLGKLPLTDGRTVWLVASERPLGDEERSGVLQVRDRELGEGAIKVAGADIAPGRVSGSIIWTTTSQEGSPLLVQITHGSHNFEAT
jgi:hypothetical protein